MVEMDGNFDYSFWIRGTHDNDTQEFETLEEAQNAVSEIIEFQKDDAQSYQIHLVVDGVIRNTWNEEDHGEWVEVEDMVGEDW